MRGSLSIFFVLTIIFYSLNSFADLIEGKSVRLQLLDKITSKIKNIDININNSYEFETLRIEIYTCYKRPPEDIPEDFALLRIFDKTKNGEEKIFQGWMISSSPSVSPLEHPIYDVWIEECQIK